MRKSGDWMVLWDDRILELLSEWDSGTPKKLGETKFIHISPEQVGRRLKKLAEHGLVKALGNGVYIITDRGEAYLAGDLDTSEDAPEEPLDTDDGPAQPGENHESV